MLQHAYVSSPKVNLVRNYFYCDSNLKNFILIITKFIIDLVNINFKLFYFNKKLFIFSVNLVHGDAMHAMDDVVKRGSEILGKCKRKILGVILPLYK